MATIRPGSTPQERSNGGRAGNAMERVSGNYRNETQQPYMRQQSPSYNQPVTTSRQQQASGSGMADRYLQRVRTEQQQPTVNPTIVQRPQRTINQQPDNNNALRNRDFRSRPGENQAPVVYNDHYSNADRPRYNNNYPYNNPRYNNYGKTGYYNSYQSPYRYVQSYPYFGQRFSRLNFSYNIIPFGGIGYYYYNGFYYRPFGSYYQVVPPPPGIVISILPFGYTRIFAGSIPYYYYGGAYYQQYDNYYRVVEPPLGARLAALPRGAEPVYINGQRYYEDNGTFYFEEYNFKNQRLYTVVGTNGVLDNQTVDRIINGSLNDRSNYDADRQIVNNLPMNCSTVTINGHEYFRSPDNVYYEAISDGSTVSYQVVSN